MEVVKKTMKFSHQTFNKVTGKNISRMKFEDYMAGYLFILLPALIIGAFRILPMIYAFFLSFQEWDMMTEMNFVGLDNYARLLSDDIFKIAVKNTVFYTAFVVPIQMVLALILAILVNQSVKFRTFFRVSYFIPAITSAAVLSVIFIGLYSRVGIINQIISSFGLSRYSFLDDVRLVLPSIMAMNIWATAGHFMIVYLAGLQDIPEQLYEAAEVDGASSWQKFWNVTLPMLKPTTFFIAVMSVIGCLQVFDQIVIMSDQGGPMYASTTVVYYIYQNGFRHFSMGYAAAMSFILFTIIFLATLAQKKYFEQTTDY